MTKRLLFLCAKRTIRASMAASILAAQGRSDQWDIWSTPVHSSQGQALARQVLEEIGIPLLESPQIIEPLFGLHWDTGVILCSGMEAT